MKWAIIALGLLPQAALAQDTTATPDSAIVAVMRDLATTARSGSLKLAALRGPPLGTPRTYALKKPVPENWTCTVRIDESLATVTCDIPAMADEANADYDRLAGLLDQAIGSRGWGRERSMEGQIRSTGGERALSYDFRRNRRLIALVNLSMRADPRNTRLPKGYDRLIILTVRGFASSGA